MMSVQGVITSVFKSIGTSQIWVKQKTAFPPDCVLNVCVCIQLCYAQNKCFHPALGGLFLALGGLFWSLVAFFLALGVEFLSLLTQARGLKLV